MVPAEGGDPYIKQGSVEIDNTGVWSWFFVQGFLTNQRKASDVRKPCKTTLYRPKKGPKTDYEVRRLDNSLELYPAAVNWAEQNSWSLTIEIKGDGDGVT